MKVAIIGGGPVGLLCAILIKQRCGNEVDVHVFEQRAQFTRKQILLIDRYSLVEYIPEDVLQKLEMYGCYVKTPSTDTNARCYKHDIYQNLPFTIRISILEEHLWDYASEVGCELHRPSNDSESEPISIYSSRIASFDVVIGADGKNSIVRKRLGIELHEKQVGNAVVLTWDPSQVKSFNMPSRSTSISRRKKKNSQNRYRLFRASDSNYYAAVQLTEKEIPMFQGISHMSELDEEGELIIESALEYYDIDIPEEFYGDAMISTFPLVVYYADKCAGVASLPGKRRKIPMFIIGDASTGVHFFSGTGVNSGFKNANVVADAVKNLLTQPAEKVVSKVNRECKLYIKEAMQKSEAVILHAQEGTCDGISVKELARIAKRKGYKGISSLPKHEKCMLMSNVLH